jgi:cbb3-type cytochrome oxidase subunit 3
MIGYIDDFKLMMLLTIALIPMVFLFSAQRRAAGAQPAMALE